MDETYTLSLEGSFSSYFRNSLGEVLHLFLVFAKLICIKSRVIQKFNVEFKYNLSVGSTIELYYIVST